MSSGLRYASLKVGDTLGLLEYEIQDDAVPLPLVAGTTVTFRMTTDDAAETNIIAAAAGTVVDADLGVVGYQRTGANVATAGLMKCQFTVVTGGFTHKSPNIQLLIEPTMA